MAAVHVSVNGVDPWCNGKRGSSIATANTKGEITCERCVKKLATPAVGALVLELRRTGKSLASELGATAIEVCKVDAGTKMQEYEAAREVLRQLVS